MIFSKCYVKRNDRSFLRLHPPEAAGVTVPAPKRAPEALAVFFFMFACDIQCTICVLGLTGVRARLNT